MQNKQVINKQLRLLSTGLLVSGAIMSMEPQSLVFAESLTPEKEQQSTDETEVVAIIQTSESSTSSNDETTESKALSATSDEERMETTTSETVDSTIEESSSQTTEESTSSSSSTTESSTQPSSTKPSETQPTKPKPTPTKPSTTTPSKPNPVKPTTPKPQVNTAKPVQPNVGNTNTSSSSIQTTGSANTTTANNQGPTSVISSEDNSYYVSPNYSTMAFVKVIGEDARKIAGENNLYASVMIAQAILESASGNSALASAPNYNLFGIKGAYKGVSTNFLTSEDNGSGSMYTIRSDFRKYPSYKESLQDYVKLLRGGVDFSNSFYSGTWKSNTASYKDATKFLTGRYATDTSYAAKLNGLIQAYQLAEYDEAKADSTSAEKKTSEKITNVPLTETIAKEDKKQTAKQEFLTHSVKKGESLKSISELYNISVMAILEKNQLDRRMIFIGQQLIIPKQESQRSLEKETAVSHSLEIAQRISGIFSKEHITSSNTKKTTDDENYQVVATRKKTMQTYEVKKGDTLTSIAQKTGVSHTSLREWNKLNQYILTEGQLLVLSAPIGMG